MSRSFERRFGPRRVELGLRGRGKSVAVDEPHLAERDAAAQRFKGTRHHRDSHRTRHYCTSGRASLPCTAPLIGRTP